jgi:TetR/AcrR family transcriptional repressor of nem operon
MDAVLELIWTGSYGTTTIDHICEKAGVKKGSFYHFFDSKSVLAVAALETSWQATRPELDAMFSATVPPLVRLQRYCDFAFEYQSRMAIKFGHVLGCPLFSIGCEVCTQENAVQKAVQSVLDYKRRYIESAIREAAANGDIGPTDSASMARMVMAFYEGLLTQARIQNDVNVLREMAPGIFGLLGVKHSEPAVGV